MGSKLCFSKAVCFFFKAYAPKRLRGPAFQVWGKVMAQVIRGCGGTSLPVFLRICMLWSSIWPYILSKRCGSLGSTSFHSLAFPCSCTYSELVLRLEVQRRCHPSLVGIRVWSPPALRCLPEVRDDHRVPLKCCPLYPLVLSVKLVGLLS